MRTPLNFHCKLDATTVEKARDVQDLIDMVLKPWKDSLAADGIVGEAYVTMGPDLVDFTKVNLYAELRQPNPYGDNVIPITRARSYKR